MAKANWCTVVPMAGTGNGTISVRTPTYYGRETRETTVRVSADSDPSVYQDVRVSQVGSTIFTKPAANKNEIPKEGGTVIITGEANCKKLSFRLSANVGSGHIADLLNPQLPEISVRATAGAQEFQSNVDITGDPGRENKYTYTITVNLKRSPWVNDATIICTVTDVENRTSKTTNFIWKAGKVTLTLSPPSVGAPSNGSMIDVTINSSDSWTVS